MEPHVPSALEYAILRASGIDLDEEETESEEPERQNFRDDSPFGSQTDESNDEGTLEDSMFWLHERGYTYQEIYKLLLPEIDQLKEGFSNKQDRKKEQKKNTGNSGGSGGRVAHGNRGDRASQMNWR